MQLILARLSHGGQVAHERLVGDDLAAAGLFLGSSLNPRRQAGGRDGDHEAETEDIGSSHADFRIFAEKCFFGLLKPRC